MFIKSVRKNNKVYISARSANFVDVGDILRTDFDGKPRYFKVTEIEATDDVIQLTAENYGYYDLLNKNGIDIRNLIGLGLIVVKNEETLEQLRKESRYC